MEQPRPRIQTRILLEAPRHPLDQRLRHLQETCLEAPAILHSASPAPAHHSVAPPPARSLQLLEDQPPSQPLDQVEEMLLLKDLEFKVIPPQNLQQEALVEQQDLDLRQLLDHLEDSEHRQLLEEHPPWEADHHLVVDPLLAPLPVTRPLLDPQLLPLAEDHHLGQRRLTAVQPLDPWPQARPHPSEEEDQDSVSRQVLRLQDNSSILGDRDDTSLKL